MTGDAASSEELVALTKAFKAMSPGERLAEARRTDLTENEQLALAVFGDDPELAKALLSHPGLSPAAEGVADSMRRTSALSREYALLGLSVFWSVRPTVTVGQAPQNRRSPTASLGDPFLDRQAHDSP